jgi:hypothetical protein
MQPCTPVFKGRLFTGFLNLLLNFFLRFFDHFFNARRMVRPSFNQFFKRVRATSRLTGSKPEIITASACHLLSVVTGQCFQSPDVSASLPIMRPFISSLGNATTDTVVSATWSAAQR